ncbi:trans-acting enoyl reductase family protein [Haloquadratum walsbyi]|uniref:Saccharopine dehydrogenase NADP binding domain-containing protein n=1 Tax=Haloquadratum walsbyi J07HQW2 TaxID=1238425 RepID=U1NJF3_9EURY|nr:saccharopine dehydrogenase NADP-binding domain-containing protein [Haloquadratum walsbyi]ERG97073.1 MAG: hypothetical protein J07HQW2_03559 [Haloquadratum walsbyi J07HQW2]
MSNINRPYDIVVWGATGFAGRLVSEYLTEQYTPNNISLALGGRSADRLDSVEADLTAKTETWDNIPIVIGDATDPESLHEITQDTRVICTTVGPYTKYGTPLVEACIETQTEYCDLTGEINWVREMVDRFHDAAVNADTRIIHSCGFDSVPADIGTLLVQSFATENFDTHCEMVRVYLEEGNGGVSGGTLASFAELFDAASDDTVTQQTLQNPYSLAPPGERDGIDSGEQRYPQNDEFQSVWTAPSPMAPINERVLRRSNALLGYPWGREFRCAEVIPTGSGIGGVVGASVVAGGIMLFTAAMSVDPVRSGIRQFVFPAPGEGPTRQQIKDGYFTVRAVGRCTTADGPVTIETEFSSELDPGYGSTARMLAESAMCLLRDEIDSPVSGGILTPASGIGKPLATRLRDIGFNITVGEQDKSASS